MTGRWALDGNKNLSCPDHLKKLQKIISWGRRQRGRRKVNALPVPRVAAGVERRWRIRKKSSDGGFLGYDSLLSSRPWQLSSLWRVSDLWELVARSNFGRNTSLWRPEPEQLSDQDQWRGFQQATFGGTMTQIWRGWCSVGLSGVGVDVWIRLILTNLLIEVAAAAFAEFWHNGEKIQNPEFYLLAVDRGRVLGRHINVIGWSRQQLNVDCVADADLRTFAWNGRLRTLSKWEKAA